MTQTLTKYPNIFNFRKRQRTVTRQTVTSIMSPCSSRGTPSIVVRTPRHASRRLRPPLVAEIRKQAKQKHIRIVGIEGRNNVVDPTHPLGMACVRLLFFIIFFFCPFFNYYFI